MTKAPLRAGLVALMILSLPGCSALSALGGAAKPLQAYELRAPDDLPAARRMSSRALVIEVPTAGGGLTTDRIMIRPAPLQAQYLPDARWTENTPEMLQTLILRSFENTGALTYVGRSPLGGSDGYALVGELTDFQAETDAGGKTATVRLRLTARLVRTDDAAVLGSRTFQASAAAASLDTPVLIETFNTAAATLMTDLTGWTLREMGVSAR